MKPLRKYGSWAWRNGLMVKNSDCPSTDPGLSSHDPCVGSRQSHALFMSPQSPQACGTLMYKRNLSYSKIMGET